ncbi:MAG: helix-turn-helix domain-containing protein [Bacteroidales bacterium]|nr:helix-turn-helix domain-containing protein [Bacteroidales bacterium]
MAAVVVDLAAAMGVSSAQISKLLSGKENMSLKTIDKLQEIFDADLWPHRNPKLHIYDHNYEALYVAEP